MNTKDQIDLLIALAEQRMKITDVESARKSLQAIGLMDENGELTEFGKDVQLAMSIPNKYNNDNRRNK